MFEPDEAEEIHKGSVGMLKGNKNISVLTTYADTDMLSSKTSAENTDAPLLNAASIRLSGPHIGSQPYSYLPVALILAAFSFLLKGQWSNALAVWQARREFLRLKPLLAIQRAENLRHARFDCIPERGSFSLLVSYYLRFERRFSQLKQIKL